MIDGHIEKYHRGRVWYEYAQNVDSVTSAGNVNCPVFSRIHRRWRLVIQGLDKELIGNSVSSVEAGSKLVNQAGSTMTEVVESIRLVTDIMSEITAASQEQSREINQINQALVDMDNVTQQNSAPVEQAAAATGSLQQQTVHLGEVVKTFKLNDAQVIRLASSRSGESAERPAG